LFSRKEELKPYIRYGFRDCISHDEAGAWLGRQQARGPIVYRCSAADAECLKAIRDCGEYKQPGLTWEQFRTRHAGVSRVHAERQTRSVGNYRGRRVTRGICFQDGDGRSLYGNAVYQEVWELSLRVSKVDGRFPLH
jgi:hypothetical protein